MRYHHSILIGLSMLAPLGAQDDPGEVVAYSTLGVDVMGCEDQLLEGFGSSIAALGDLDGDGNVDLAIGERGASYKGLKTGAVWIVFLDAGGKPRHLQRIDSFHGGFGDGLRGPLTASESFGGGLTSLGDLDGDGILDLAVGTPGHSTTLSAALGAVWILFLNADGTVKASQRVTAGEGGFAGSLVDGARFGSSLASLGDLNGDGVVDLAVGAAGHQNLSGSLWVLFLRPDGTVKADREILGASGDFDLEVQPGDYFGDAICNLVDVDVDGDGTTDMAVGAWGRDAQGAGPAGADRGLAWIVFLNSDATVRSLMEVRPPQGPYPYGGPHFGIGLAGLGDLDGDGLPDLAIGVDADIDANVQLPYLPPSFGFGAIHVYFLHADGTVKSRTKLSDTDGGLQGALTSTWEGTTWDPCGLSSLGKSLAAIGDINGDGVRDLAAGSNSNSERIWLLRLNAAIWDDVGHSLAGRLGEPRLSGGGTLVDQSEVALALRGGPPAATGAMIVGTTTAFLPFLGGTLVPAPDFISHVVQTDADGHWSGRGRWPAGIPSDSVYYLQAWVEDPTAPAGFAASNALSAQTP